MMQDKYEKSGRLWVEPDAVIHKKGSITLNGKKRYIAFCESKNNLGKPKYELLMSVGLLFVNSDKLNEKSPDISGNITIDLEKFKFSGWKNETMDGTPVTDVKITEFIDKEKDDYPF